MACPMSMRALRIVLSGSAPANPRTLDAGLVARPRAWLASPREQEETVKRDARHEAAHVRPPGDASHALGSEAGQRATEDLAQEPEEEVGRRRQLEEEREEEYREQRDDAREREENEVRAQHARD